MFNGHEVIQINATAIFDVLTDKATKQQHNNAAINSLKIFQHFIEIDGIHFKN